MTNGIHFRMVVKSTCLNNMYHYRYQERTTNKGVDIPITKQTESKMSKMKSDLIRVWYDLI